MKKLLDSLCLLISYFSSLLKRRSISENIPKRVPRQGIVDVGKAIAKVTMINGDERCITRQGSRGVLETVHANDLLQKYLHGKYTLLCDDNGEYFSTSNIRNIKIEVQPLLERYED